MKIKDAIPGLLPWDDDIEFVGVRDTMEVLWLRYGATHYFKDLPDNIYRQLEQKYLSDQPAVQYISGLSDDLRRQVELYTFFLYGDVDHIPDWSSGKLGETENFRISPECPSVDFANKHFTLRGNPVTPRELRIIDLFRREYTDSAIAEELGIHIQTFYYHKKKLFKKAGVQTRAGLINIANSEKL